MLENDSTHHLVLLSIHESGFEEWSCPVCGRCILMRWSPAYERVVIEPGDVLAAHSAWKGPTTDLEAAPKVNPDSPSLAPWQEWMDKVNFDELWTDYP